MVSAAGGTSADVIGSAPLFEALINAAVDAIVVIDEDGRILHFNPGAERLFGFAAEEVLRKRIEMLMPQPYRREHRGYIKNYLKTGERRIIGIGRQVTACTREGEKIPVDLAVGETRIGALRLFVGIIRDLRRRTHLETMLRQERQRAERIFELVDVVIIGVDAQGQVLLVNRKGGEILGAKTPPIGSRWLDDWVAAEDRAAAAEAIESLFRSADERRTADAEYRIQDAAGRLHTIIWKHRYVAASETGEPPLVLLSGSDVTEIHRFAKLLKESESRLRQLFDQAPVGIVNLDARGQIRDVNHALCKMLEESPDRLRGISFAELLAADPEHTYEGALAALTAGESRQSELQLMLALGSVRLKTRVRIGILQDPDGPNGFVLQIVDRTREIAAEAEAERLSDRLAHSQRLGLLGELTAGIAHEINQPLTAIATYTDGARRLVAREGPGSEDLDFALGQIGDQARRAAKVIARIRALVQGKQAERSVTDINALIQEVIPLAALEARELGTPIKLHLNSELPAVRADRIQIQQVVLNLIRNSLDALATASQARKGVKVTTRLNSAGEVAVEIADHGVGIPEDLQGKIFDPFFSSKPTGMGMGLSICKTIMRAHQGRLWYCDNDGGGSRFVFTLPAVAEEQTEDAGKETER